MSNGWYLEADGVTHRFHSDGEWSDHVLGPERVPVDEAFPLGIVDGEGLSAAAADAQGSYLTSMMQGDPVQFALSRFVPQDSSPLLLVSATSPHGAVVGTRPLQESTATGFTMALPNEAVDQLHELQGSCDLATGADEDWSTILSLRTAAGHRRVRTLREPVADASSRILSGAVTAEARVPRAELVELLRQVSRQESVTLAMVPDRLLIRGPEGLLGTIASTDFTGTPATAQYEPNRLADGIANLPRSIRTVHLQLRAMGEVTKLVAGGEGGWYFTTLEKGWSYS